MTIYELSLEEKMGQSTYDVSEFREFQAEEISFTRQEVRKK